MRLQASKLESHLAGSLAPVYLVYGDEPFGLEQVCHSVREAAKGQGHDSRDVMHVEPKFDWSRLMEAANALSLFAEKRLIELRMPTGKPGTEGGKALQAYCANPPMDTILLVIAGKLEKAQQSSKWFKALDKSGAVIPVWPVKPEQLPAWIRERMALRDMQPSDEALALLVDKVEGNLLAADQELEKLRLLTGGGRVEVEQVAAAVSDSARFDIFGLVDVALKGDAGRTARMLSGLRSEGVEPILILWALSREIRSLCGMSQLMQQGQSAGQAMGQFRVWQARQAPVQAALRRYNLKRWQGLLWQAGELEKVLKGQAAGKVWDDLLKLTMKLSGKPLFTAGRG